jgi:PAS domain S-box-containing protein
VLAVDPDLRISQYAHTAWRVRDGAFAGTPDAITQTTDGYLWIGTTGGLVRFDGVRFVPWVPPAGKRLLSSNISALLGARDGSLWIGTDAGLSRWKDGELVNYLDPVGSINDIQEDRNGTIWLSRSNLNDDKGSLCEVISTDLRCHGKSDGVPSLVGGPLLCDVGGNVWMGGSSMLTRWKADSSRTYPIKGLESGGDFSGVQALANTPDGSLMVGMTRSGPSLGLQEFADGVWRPFVVPGLDGRNLVIDALFMDREKALWIGTSAQGLYRVHDGTVDHFRGADGLTGEAVYGFYEDNEGDVWAATSEGLDRFRDFRVTSFSTREGLRADGVQTVLASRNGTIWVGNFATLDSLHDGTISSIGRKDGLPGEHPSSLFEDHAGRLWVGVDSELSIYQKGKFTRIRRPDGSPIGRAVALTEDRDGDLWIESYGPPRGLLRIRDFKVLDALGPPAMPNAASLTADPEGGIWLGLMNGDLARYRNGQLTTYNFDLGQSDSRVRRVEVRANGTVLGAAPSGVIGWHDGKKQILNSRNGLPCDFIYTLISDKTGTLWLYTQCGLVAVASDDLQRWWDHPETTLKVRTFDVFDGAQPAIVFNQPSASLSPDGKVWFANGTVLQMVDPAHVGGNSVPPPVHIEEVTADRKRYLPAKGLGLPPSTRDLEIDYTALSFPIPQKVHFQYKLEGYDRDWQDAGTRRQAFYTNLRPRSYTFRVKASNNSGLWNEAGASLDFFVAPAYYQTNWFRFCCVAALIALLWALHRWRVHGLTSQEKRLRDVVETIPAMTFTTLADGSNTFVNNRWTEYTRLSAEQSSDTGWQRAIHAEDLARHSEKWRISVTSGQPFEDEARFRRAADGEYRWFLVRGVPLQDRHGRIIRWYGTLTDIEDRKRAEEALQGTQFYLNEGQRLAHMGCWAFNGAGFTYWSSELFQVHGLDPRREPPTAEEYLAVVHPDDREFIKQEIAKMMADYRAFDFTKRIVRPDGTIRYVRCVGTPATQGEIFQGFVGTGIDVTEQELLEQERGRLRQLETDLAHTNRVSMLGELAASLAHEIKQPIAAAMTSANSCIEWLAHEPPNLDRARAAAAKIDKYGNRAAEIIDHIRSLYRKSPPQSELISVNEIVNEIFTLLQGEAIRYSIAMRPELAGELPKVKADPVQLQQVFMNLMLNAIEAMRDEGGELTVKSQGKDGHLLFSVSDTGPGLPTGNVDQIFSAFFTTKPQGSGMGLAISRSIVESHGGRLWATANDARGATFHFTLPTEMQESSSLYT